MTSTRAARKASRASSPLHRPTNGSANVSLQEKPKNEMRTALDDWSEPPLRPPAPSFEDYKGLERVGVLEHMAPLGSLPGHKKNHRMRNGAVKKLSIVAGTLVVQSDGRKVVEDAASLIAENSDVNTTAAPSPRSSVERERTPERSSSPAAFSQSTNSIDSLPASDFVSYYTEKMDNIVDSACKMAHREGDVRLAFSIRRIYEESKTNQRMIDILNSVLQGLSTEDTKEWNEWKAAIKSCKRVWRKLEREKKSRFKSIEFSQQQQEDEQEQEQGQEQEQKQQLLTETADGLENEGASDTVKRASPNSNSPHERNSSQLEISRFTKDSNQPVESTEMTRSKSTSSTSSLSSLSSIDASLPPALPLVLTSSTKIRPKSRLKNTSKTSTASTTTISTPRLILTVKPPTHNPMKRRLSEIAETEEEIRKKRKQLQKAFEDYAVTPSNIRSETHPHPHPSHFFATSDPVSRSSLSVPPSTTNNIPRPSSKESGSKLSFVTTRSAAALKFAHEDTLQRGKAKSVDAIEMPAAKTRRNTRKRQREDDDLDLRLQNVEKRTRTGIERSRATPSASRSATPHALGRPPKQLKRSVRVKMSANRKKSAVAGVTRERAQRATPMANEIDNELVEDNNDFCSACSGGGKLVCCDGCIRSFHFSCADPPVNPKTIENEQWFCNICRASKEPPSKRSRGLFSALLDTIEFWNPVSFCLPEEIREYFEGVRTGDEGQYEEAITHKTRARPNNFEDKEDSPPKLVDGKGNPIICYRCGLSSMHGKRKIISCDFCHTNWHIDCLDPPMVIPPIKARDKTNPNSKWMCPNHVEHEFKKGLKADLSNDRAVYGGNRCFKVRKPKHATVVDSYLRRGLVNNGIIEIENESSDEDEEDKVSVIPRISELGLKLDFIYRAKQKRLQEMREEEARWERERAKAEAERQKALEEARKAQESMERVQAALSRHSFSEQQLVLFITSFVTGMGTTEITTDKLVNLTNALTATAPPEVVARMDDTCAMPTADRFLEKQKSKLTKQVLLTVQDLISKLLKEADEEQPSDVVDGSASESGTVSGMVSGTECNSEVTASDVMRDAKRQDIP